MQAQDPQASSRRRTRRPAGGRLLHLALAVGFGLAASLAQAVPAAAATVAQPTTTADAASDATLNRTLATVLRRLGFTGKVEENFESRLGRPVNQPLAEVGRRLFFDPLTGLHNDNTCAGCHAPNAAFGDTQSIAIGIQNNLVVGAGRKGPRNQRRAPSTLNVAFFPQLMWNARFGAPSGDPFDNSQGFLFPQPEGSAKFPPNDPVVTHLLIAHGHMPITELNEAAGFTGTKGTISPEFDQFDDGLGGQVPMPDSSGYRNEPIRDSVMGRLNAAKGYRQLFGNVFPEVKGGSPITELMYAQAIAEFEFTLVRANAPIDQFARGDQSAMSSAEKRGALLFFGKANCVACHAVSGKSGEMFSDFKNHAIGVPQIAPYFGAGLGSTIFDGDGQDEDFGLAQITGLADDRYKFRTSPLRNVALQKTFFHNGAYTRLEDAIRHHLNVYASARSYDPKAAGVAKDLRQRKPPVEPMLQQVDPLMAVPVALTQAEFDDLNQFVGNGLLDSRAKHEDFCEQIPPVLPSGMRPLKFQGCGR